MKKLFALTLFAFVTLNATAQKEEKIEYYTDDNVKRSKVYMGLNYSPYYLTRNIIGAGTVSSDPVNIILNQSSKGGYGQAYGINIFYKLGSSLHIGTGISGSNGSYSLDLKDALKQVGINTDSLSGDFIATTTLSYINVPINFNYSASLSDEWDLEVMPTLELNFIQKLQRDSSQTMDVDGLIWGDLVEAGHARDVNWTVGFGLGGNYHITENFTFFVRPQVRYTLRPILKTSGEYSDNPNEVLLWIGGQTGIRLYF